MYKMTFNGIQKDYLTVMRKERPPWASLQRNLISVPGKPGAYVESTDMQPRLLKLTVLLESKNLKELQTMKEDFAAWLVTEEPKELIIDDEPDRIYYAMVDGEAQFDEIISVGAGVITFICPDPYKYGSEDGADFVSSTSFTAKGTAETEPIIECTLKADTTFVAVSDGSNLNMVGTPAKQDETPTEWQTPILMSTANSLVGWTSSSPESLDGTPNIGTLLTDGNYFYANDYGNNPNVWHGPAMKTSLSEAIDSFRFDIGFHMIKTGANQAGAIIVSLLDASNRNLATLQMTKHFGELDTLYSRIAARDNNIVSEHQAQFTGLFHGVYRLYRLGNSWEAFIWFIEANGNWREVLHQRWTDHDNIASANATQVQVRVLQRAGFPTVDQKINDIQVYRLNDMSAGQVPIIGKSGDVITFDHKNNNILKNGESILRDKAFIGQYYSLTPGLNTISVEPANAIESVKVRYRPKWL